ncbi:PilZ domain-containing protein [Deferrisoma sp.]
MPEERRRHERIPKRATITCQEITYPLGQAPELEAEMLDVSEGGVRLVLGRPLDPERPVQVALRLVGWSKHSSEFLKHDQDSVTRPLTAIGRVARHRPLDGGRHEVGIEFVDIWDDHWQAMRRYLEREKERLARVDPPAGAGLE